MTLSDTELAQIVFVEVIPDEPVADPLGLVTALLLDESTRGLWSAEEEDFALPLDAPGYALGGLTPAGIILLVQKRESPDYSSVFRLRNRDASCYLSAYSRLLPHCRLREMSQEVTRFPCLEAVLGFHEEAASSDEVGAVLLKMLSKDRLATGPQVRRELERRMGVDEKVALTIALQLLCVRYLEQVEASAFLRLHPVAKQELTPPSAAPLKPVADKSDAHQGELQRCTERLTRLNCMLHKADQDGNLAVSLLEDSLGKARSELAELIRQRKALRPHGCANKSTSAPTCKLDLKITEGKLQVQTLKDQLRSAKEREAQVSTWQEEKTALEKRLSELPAT